MATADFVTPSTGAVTTSHSGHDKNPSPAGALNRIRTVRLQQGASLRSVARQSGVDIRQLRMQERESTDLRVSDLRKWQKALDVPLEELLVEPDSALSRPVMERARLVRLMKTATAIRERAESAGIRRMARMLCEQLVDLMPELRDVSPWHEFGKLRSLDEYGRIVTRTISDDLLHHVQSD